MTYLELMLQDAEQIARRIGGRMGALPRMGTGGLAPDAEVKARREKVVRLRMKGLSRSEIAEALESTQTTIAQDIKVLRIRGELPKSRFKSAAQDRLIRMAQAAQTQRNT